MTSPLDKLREYGYELPQPKAPVATYVPITRTGNIVYVSGQISSGAEGVVTGLLGGHTEQRPVTELLAEHGVDELTPADVTFAVAALVADAADALRRERR